MRVTLTQFRFISVASLFCLISFAAAAIAQESKYSADSLMAAFEKGSKISLKGTEITFRDVVVESKNSKLVFKSSQHDKVICELVPSTRNRDKLPSVGRTVTVIGRARGRGLLGNVTLDDCTVAPAGDSTISQDAVPQEIASAPPDIVSEELVLPAPVPEQPEEPAKELVTTQKVRAAKRGAGKPKQDLPSPRGVIGQQDEAAKGGADSQRGVPYGFYGLLVLSGAVAYWILAKLLGPAIRAMRFSTRPACENTAEIRQAALEALLLKASKKR